VGEVWGWRAAFFRVSRPPTGSSKEEEASNAATPARGVVQSREVARVNAL